MIKLILWFSSVLEKFAQWACRHPKKRTMSMNGFHKLICHTCGRTETTKGKSA